MVADFREGEILGELQDLEDEIAALDNAVACFKITLIKFDLTKTRHTEALERLAGKLQQEKERQEMCLMVHRQKVKESGKKY